VNSNFYLPQTEPFIDAIHSIWQIDGLTVFKTEHILPKGIVEVIFNFGDCNSHISARIEGKQCHLRKCFINSFNTSPIQLQLPKHQNFFGVVFQPLAVKKVFGIPAGEFSDLLVDLTLIDSAFLDLWHQLSEHSNFKDRVSVLLGWVGKKILASQPQEKLINNFYLLSMGMKFQ
jgi:hypothetical protein